MSGKHVQVKGSASAEGVTQECTCSLFEEQQRDQYIWEQLVSERVMGDEVRERREVQGPYRPL